ncbi:MAG: alpha/beta hydrolase [Burkholderiales bacterium]|nr:MAG: alpha/beta hydrolase [Burkholderiales bacterium]
MTRKVLIVPGLNGSGEGHWQRFWLEDFEEAQLVEQADWTNPEAGRWQQGLEAAIRDNPGAIIVAHSLGTILVARLANSPVASLVGCALLVAPADIERTSALHARSYEFGRIPTDPLPFPAQVVASRDDVYMSLEKAVALAKSWQAPLFDAGYVGHINVASGFGRWVEGYELARQVADRCHERPQRATQAQAQLRSF